MNEGDLADALLLFVFFIVAFVVAGLLGWMSKKIDNHEQKPPRYP